MDRTKSSGNTRAGRWLKEGTKDEPYLLFIPHPLPPKPSVRYDNKLQDLLERANRALGRLDGISAFLPDPDLFIRTSGEQRISNFFLWQLAYAEFYFSPVYWPDFGIEQFQQALASYDERERRYGKTSQQMKEVKDV